MRPGSGQARGGIRISQGRRADPGSSTENTLPRSRVELVFDISVDIMNVKPVTWLGDSREQVRDFPNEARGAVGFELWEVQQGKEPSDWKPMPTVGLGVNEIRVRAGGAFRLIYVARFSEAVYVLHAFRKKSQKTARADIELARRRFRALVQERKQQ